jgi:catechol-2,3-dioxygenase
MKDALGQLSDKGYLHLAFKTQRDRFPAIIESLKQHKVEIDGGPIKRGDGESIYFNDPDYNHLEIHYDN